MCACFVVAGFWPAQVTEHKHLDSSGLNVDALTGVQIANLTIPGKVWGFLKYHNPAVTAGSRDWDRDLFQVMPRVLAAPDQASVDAALFRWITDLGGIAE